MNIVPFLIREGFLGLRRARVSAAIATLTITISIILIGLFLIITLNLSRYLEVVKGRLEIEVFLDDSFSEQKIQSIKEQLDSIPGVAHIVFISKEMALREFNRLFDQGPEDYFETLGFNPLPISFRLKLAPDYLTTGLTEQVVSAITKINGIKEADIRYDRRILLLIENNIKLAVAIDIVVGAIICLSALLLVSNNIRLIILSRRKLIQTMKLVGATRRFIQAPLFIQGVIQGLLGGLVASGFLFLIVRVSSIEVRHLIVINWQLYPLLVILGVVLGFLGSFTAVRRYL